MTVTKHADLYNNYVFRIEVLRPNKPEALIYIDDITNTPATRWGQITIYQGAQDAATLLDEYMMGPLPVTDRTQIQPRTFNQNSSKHSSPNLVPDSEFFRDWPYSVATGISDITHSLLGAVINIGNRSDFDGLELSFRDLWTENGRMYDGVCFNGQDGLQSPERYFHTVSMSSWIRLPEISVIGSLALVLQHYVI